MSAAELRTGILDLLTERDPDTTSCPSEVARRIGGDDWRDLMGPVRAAAAELADHGQIEVVQKGEPVDVCTARGPVRLRRGPAWPVTAPRDVHWLLPIDPTAHMGHQPVDWRTRDDASAIWAAIGRSQPVDRWCLRTGFRTMRPGDTVWAYLSKRQQVCARGLIRAVLKETDGWFCEIDWDEDVTAVLCRYPIPRSVFGQVPMSVCRAGAVTVESLQAAVRLTGSQGRQDSSTFEVRE